MDHPGVTEIERAATFLLRCRSSFGGDQTSFAVGKTSGVGISRESLAQRVREFHARTDRLVIENLPWQRLLKNYDAAGSFFFLDPPYVGDDVGAYAGFSQADMTQLREALRTIKGTWLVTVNDSPANRALFRGCNIRSVATKNGVQKSNKGGTNATFGELIITLT
jgi:DNA adenine methylase